MTEISYYWNGNSIGDASLSPYTELVFHSIWRKLFLRDRTSQGIVREYEDECEVSGVSGGVSVGSGAALVDGQFYVNTNKLTIAIPTPSTSTRVDVITLRRNITSQTIRATRVIGTEGAGTPSIIQQDSNTWDLPLAEVSITTAGVITVTDVRENAVSALFPAYNKWELIEEIIAEGSEEDITFSNIPQTYKHLKLISVCGYYDPITGLRGTGAKLYLNGDTTGANYNDVGVQSYPGLPAGTFAVAGNNSVLDIISDNPGWEERDGWKMLLPYYTNTNFFKMIYYEVNDFEEYNIKKDILWENTNAITSITFSLSASGNDWVSNSIFALYGIE